MFYPAKYVQFFQRRRARRARGDSGRSYTFELAALHLELLVAMAAVDGDVDALEAEEVLGFVDRAALPAEDRLRLHDLAQAALQHPPNLRSVSAQLSQFEARPALARMMVQDLVKVAAADAHADPREQTLLEFICTALSIDIIQIPTKRVLSDADEVQRVRTPMPRITPSSSVREAVRRTLEASYASREEPFGQ